MQYIDPMAVASAVIYFLGIYLHYIHVSTIFHLLERHDEMNTNKAILQSMIWPWVVLTFMYYDFTGQGDEYD